MLFRKISSYFSDTDSLIESKKYKKYFLLYTFVFIFTFVFTFCWYWAFGRSFIYTGDGKTYWQIMVYFAKFVRSIIKTLIFEHKFVVPEYDLAIGEGYDILGYAYNCLDPLTFLVVIIPTKYIALFYDITQFLRIYIAGFSFSCLCFYVGKKKGVAVLAGAITYAFCYWAIVNMARHYFFLTHMMYLPVAIMGIEKILNKEKPYVFILSIFVSAISSFYFFYMTVLAIVIYTVIRLIILYYKNYKIIFAFIGKVFVCGVLGVMMAAVVLLPMLYIMLHAQRLDGVKFALPLFYNIRHYMRLPMLFIAQGSSVWLCMGYSVPTLLSIFLLLRKKSTNKLLKCLFITGCVIIFFPACGKLFNGWGYVTNRWSWMFALVCAFILTEEWPNLMQLEFRDGIYLFKCITVYSFICFLFLYSRDIRSFVSLTLGFIVLFLLLPLENVNIKMFYRVNKQLAAFLVMLISVFCNSYFQNSRHAGNYANTAFSLRDLSTGKNEDNIILRNETLAVRKFSKSDDVKDFFRYSGRRLSTNAGTLSDSDYGLFGRGLSSTNLYLSVLNPCIAKYRKELGVMELDVSFKYHGYDTRAIPTALSSSLYYSVPKNDKASVPYGFSRPETFLDFKVYRNDNFLPFVYSYDEYITSEQWEKLSAVEKQEVMFNAVYVYDKTANLNVFHSGLKTENISYQTVCNGDNVVQNGNSFAVTKNNSTVTLNFEGLQDCETYISLNNLRFSGTSDYDLYFGKNDVDPNDMFSKDKWKSLSLAQKFIILENKFYWSSPVRAIISLNSSNKVKKSFYYNAPAQQFYSGQHDFTINMGYSEEPVTSITITFPTRGVYSFDDISVWCQPMDGYEERIAELKKDTLQNVKFEPNTVSGTMSLDRPKFAVFSIPYSKGWKAYVNGKEAKLYNANVAYMGLELDKGEHDIKLVYRRPWQRAGIYVSLLGFIVFCVLVFVCERRDNCSGGD